ncbi:MBOAT family O-acyltransferase [Oceanidesulfovibrio marinus]|uniref:MBOAT family protein n=1 Tax=Oceanidesulfovibrio marinus TaxID=370038 RepID=A0A6P1ZJD3_9BACT|nr:MBOAT family protein [Oceanidesulfovibrio marinus]QJT10716.1 MBOAT family protein [Oceanidesulfovibrio marinus]TVM34057.1 MBOAT family protein [Oceanidesulfovibrio marinus]
MVFSSPLFLFLYLPLVLGIYLLGGKKLRNFILFAASIFFYAWGEPFHVGLLLASIGLNFIFGLLIDTPESGKSRRKLLLGVGVAINLLLLLHFKYANFIVVNLNQLAADLGTEPWITEYHRVHLPIGISFFTFQAVSYLIDVYRGLSQPQKSPLKLGLYISMFPQLIAGPIVRYEHVAAEMEHREMTLPMWSVGVRRFVIGLAKKVFIANTMGALADQVMTLPPNEISTSLAWLGAICYTMQIFYDFAGYSDMAIGLGLIFGFHFPENFNYPYISRSLQEFWRRWHITLSTWFRDYLYIPLGGSRRGSVRTYVNIAIVFTLTGIWHGASWNFLFWGAFHGLFLIFERLGLKKALERLPAVVSHVYCILVFVIGWVFFRIDDIGEAWRYVGAMFGMHSAKPLFDTSIYVNTELVITLALAFLFSMPVAPWLENKAEMLRSGPGRTVVASVQGAFMVLMLMIAVFYTASSTYNPFIYFRF